MSNKRKITKIVACLFLVALLTVAVFGAISSAADTEGRTFKGNTKAASQSERLELAKPLEEVPLTYIATVKINSLDNADYKGPIFGQWPGTGVNTAFNFELHTKSPALCYSTMDDASKSMTSVVFGNTSTSTPIETDGATNTLADHLNEWVTVAIVVTPQSNGSHNFDCYIAGEKAYETVNRTNFVVTANGLAASQALNPFAIGSNNKATPDNFPGAIKDIALYSSSLSESEIKAYCEASKNGTALAESDALIAYYNMSEVEDPFFEEDLSGNGYHARRDDKLVTYTSGTTFSHVDTDAERLTLEKKLDKMPLTYEAVIKYNSGLTYNQAKTIFGNYNNGSTPSINFEMYQHHKPALCYSTTSKNSDSVIFANAADEVEAQLGNYFHLAITVEETETAGTYDFICYINGVEADRITKAVSFRSIDKTQDKNFMIGTNFNTKGGSFLGSIASIKLYDRPLTEAEVYLASTYGKTFSEGIIAEYDLSTNNPNEARDISGNGYHAKLADAGRSFSIEEPALALTKPLEEAPLTISADVYLPTSGVKANTIFGNYYARDYINFEITGGGKAALVINELPKNKIETKGSAYIHSIVFNEVIPAAEWVNLTVTFDRYSTSADRYKLYINGVESTAGYGHSGLHNDKDADSNNIVTHNFELDMEWIQRAIPFTLGRDASKVFTGSIRSLALYSDTLSAADVASAFENGADLSRDDIIAYYDLNSDENTESFVKDETGHGYNFAYEFYENDSGLDADDYDYSFAFMGDIQFLTYKDSTEGTQTTKPVFDWLIANKDNKKLEYVFGLGDVTDKNETAEWEVAVDLFKTLGENGIKYAVTPGNHDGPYDYINYNNAFANDTYLASGIVCMEEGKLENYYKTFTVGGYEYMVMVLEFGAPNDVLTWANGVVAANPDKQVIVLTHGYIGYDGGFLSETELHCPPTGDDYNSGEEIWQKFISQHSNIVISAAGHIDPYNIKHREDVGANGNTVHQFLIDNQGLDKGRNYDTGMIAMFYFSNGGKDVRVEYVSTTKSLRCGKEIVFGRDNQFNFTIGNETVASEIETKYGTLPLINSDLDINKVVLFAGDANKTFLGGFSSIDKAFAKVIAENGNYDTFNILLRDDARMSSKVAFGAFVGTLDIDLGGNELKIDEDGNYLIDVTVRDGSAPKATFNIYGGSLTKAHGRGIVCMNYTAGFSADSETNFNFTNVHFRSLSSKYNANTIFTTWENGYDGATAVMKVTSVFTDCTFDMAESMKNAVMLPLDHATGDRVIHSVTINGGEIIAESDSDFTARFATLNTGDRKDTFTYGNEGGSYTSITLPLGSEAPAVSYDGLKFVLSSATASTVTYVLAPEAPVEFVPKSSVTLYTDFTYNIYLPKTDKLTSVTLDNNPVDINTLKTETIKSKEYYKLAVKLNSFEALRDIVVDVTVDGHKGSFTFGTESYAAAIISGSYTEVEKTLIKDMLSYVRAAYLYFDRESEKLDGVSSLLGEGYDEASKPDMTKEVKTPSGTGFSSVTFHLGDSPAYRFYYTTDEAPSYTFTVGDRTVSANDVKAEKYVEVKVYAFEMLLGISFTDGADTYEYNVYSYYANAEDNVKPLVERLVKYCESAEAYRASIAGN